MLEEEGGRMNVEDYAGATVLAIVERRWQVDIHLRLEDGSEAHLIASAPELLVADLTCVGSNATN